MQRRGKGKGRKKFVRKPPGKCAFCLAKVGPDYKQTEALSRQMTDRGRIVARSRSGLCQKHQKRLATAIKQARHLALLPFVTGHK